MATMSGTCSMKERTKTSNMFWKICMTVGNLNYELPLTVAARVRVCVVFCRSAWISWVKKLFVASQYV